MAKKKQEVVEEAVASQEDMDEAFIQGKSVLLGEWLKENQVAIQPVLEYTKFGIRPNALLVKYDK